MELEGGNGNERKGDVTTTRPWEVLVLLNLHRKVHRSLGALLPSQPRDFISVEPLPYIVPNRLKVGFVELVAEIRGIDRVPIQGDFVV